MDTFGKALKTFRLLRCITLRKLADELDISASYLSDIEKDKRNPPNYKTLINIKRVIPLNKLEFHHLCDLAGEATNLFPPDITSNLNKLPPEEKIAIWDKLRDELEQIKNLKGE